MAFFDAFWPCLDDFRSVVTHAPTSFSSFMDSRSTLAADLFVIVLFLGGGLPTCITLHFSQIMLKHVKTF